MGSDQASGAGGGGGYVSTALNATANPIKVSIGSGGSGNWEPSRTDPENTHPATSGGTSNVVDQSTGFTIVQAMGGKAASLSLTPTTIAHMFTAGTGNGDGGIGEKNGTDGSGYKFNDSSLGLAGGGGGGGGMAYSSYWPRTSGGKPGGGRGSFGYPDTYADVTIDYQYATRGIWGGGAGGGCIDYPSEIVRGASGGGGICWIRVRR